MTDMTIPDLKEHLQLLEEHLLTDEVRLDPLKLKKYLAEDFFEFGSSGHIWHMQSYLGENGAGIIDASIANFSIHPLSEDIVLVTYLLENRTRHNYSLRSSIWKIFDGVWKMVFHQGTVKADSQITRGDYIDC